MTRSGPDNRLTPAQARVLAFLEARLARDGLPPTRNEICAGLGFRSPNAAEAHLRTLARKGMITLLPGASRGIRLNADNDNSGDGGIDSLTDKADRRVIGEHRETTPGLPIIGRVAAGSPILAEPHIDGHCPISANWFHPRADYLLRVHGDSMRDAGIADGDLLAVHRIDVADNGQIVVARLDDAVTVKRFQQKGRHVWLMPENPDFAAIAVDLREQPLVIEGLGVGLLRNGLPQRPTSRSNSTMP